MEREFIKYTEALTLKELGFDEECFDASDLLKFNNKNIAIPLYQQAFRWFREKHGWIGSVWQCSISKEGVSSFEYMIDKLDDLAVSQFRQNFTYKTYDGAEQACLEKLIEIIKNK